MAVLYRMNAFSRVLETPLRTAAVPYVIAWGTAFFDRKEVRDACVPAPVGNPADADALARIGVNVLARVGYHVARADRGVGGRGITSPP